MKFQGVEAIIPASRQEWRNWLAKNHTTAKSVWVVIYHKASGKPTVYYEEAVEEGLCFGWIDSVARKRDAISRYQYFAVRKPKSNWSALNRTRAARLIKAGLMTTAGKKMINLAKKTGTWTALKKIERMEIPDDLQKEFNKNNKAFVNFGNFPTSSKKIILEWIMNAKRPETRKQRIETAVSMAAKNERANHWTRKKEGK